MMNFGIPNRVGGMPFTLSQAIASTVAPVTAGVLKTVAGSLFEGGKMALGAASMMAMAMGNPIGAIGASLLGAGMNMAEGVTMGAIDGATYAAMGRGIPFSPFQGQAFLPSIYQRAAMGNFAGGAQQAIYAQMGGGMPYMNQGSFSPVMGNSVGGSPIAGIPLNPYAAYNTNAATAAVATAQNGFMPSGNSSLDLANSIANSPMYSPTEQSLLNSITDPKQRAMQALQMQMQHQALLATMLTNLANMRHEMLKAVANNLRA